ncbi:MAG: hypothetical protein Q7T93_08585 [Methylobacterium sp.]|jgi:hypothetical protein|uniref:hypothetical protein n=1 Tax=unclassified Methylobacterium TaxID=2615210 RepID=UPI0011CB947D|nr:MULTISPECIES: hypothetical protein [unclassified Methylobacterium]MDO9426879.1 hypothetical protein [Methylobacterium sp.]TXM74034.1 hypothetical protein FV218_10645 [Methylobacterium sp. WL69]
MSVDKFAVASSARMQVDRLPPPEKRALTRLFSGDAFARPENTQPTPTGRFVSRLGARRVLWQRSDGGRPEILSILDRSYAD